MFRTKTERQVKSERRGINSEIRKNTSELPKTILTLYGTFMSSAVVPNNFATHNLFTQGNFEGSRSKITALRWKFETPPNKFGTQQNTSDVRVTTSQPQLQGTKQAFTYLRKTIWKIRKILKMSISRKR